MAAKVIFLIFVLKTKTKFNLIAADLLQLFMVVDVVFCDDYIDLALHVFMQCAAVCQIIFTNYCFLLNFCFIFAYQYPTLTYYIDRYDSNSSSRYGYIFVIREAVQFATHLIMSYAVNYGRIKAFMASNQAVENKKLLEQILDFLKIAAVIVPQEASESKSDGTSPKARKNSVPKNG
jgi:hypothetical protein